MSRPNLRPVPPPGAPPVCVACGQVTEDAKELAWLREAHANLREEHDKKLATIRSLKRQQDQALKYDPHYDDACKVLMKWKELCHPDAREPLSVKRMTAVIARLSGGYTVDELVRAAEGYSLKPYVVNGRRTHEGPKDDWRADAELIYRDAKHVDAGIRIAERADDLRQVLATGDVAAPAAVNAPLGPIGNAAVRMASKGFYVFPCKPREKVPATMNGLKDAKRDLDAIRSYWSRAPQANVAIATGSLSGIVVLDVDGDEGWDSLHKLEDAHEELPDTASVTTPRGGQHFWFLHPGWNVRNTAGFPGPGLDIRGDGGYVLAPPSIGPGGRPYEVDDELAPAPMPDWLLETLRSYQSKVDQALSGETDWLDFLMNAPSEGERNTRMTKWVGKLFSYEMTPAMVFATAAGFNAQCKPPLPDKELAGIVRSIAAAEAR